MPSFPIIIDTSFAENVNTKGNRCGVTFSPPLQIPRDANPRLRLYSSSLAYNFPNASAELGNCEFLQCTVLGKHGAVSDDATIRGRDVIFS